MVIHAYSYIGYETMFRKNIIINLSWGRKKNQGSIMMIMQY
jgi:hypothetical protein